MKPKLLVLELWGLGDLIIATPFLRAACKKFAVTLVSKPYGKELQGHFWPEIEVIQFLAPWTVFKHKYRLYAWPWRELFHLHRRIGGGQFDVGLSARWDPRDHLLLRLARARLRLGYNRLGSGVLLTHPLERPAPTAHRSEYWRTLGRELDLDLSESEQPALAAPGRKEILVHSGAGQAVRVWPLPRYQELIGRLRQRGHPVQVACDPDQLDWWLQAGEKTVVMPHNVTELLALINRAAMLIGNDSGPGHIAALAGIPTFTIFGPQLPEWFAPSHPSAEWIEGKPCPFKPCSDYCRWPQPRCLMNLAVAEVWERTDKFIRRHLA
jgi:ADP-heptose:LPS heptosyltransferase